MVPIRIGAFLLFVATLTGCSLAGGPTVVAPRPRDGPPSPAHESPPDPSVELGREGPSRNPDEEGSPASPAGEAHEIAIAVVEAAYEAIGTPYQWGGNGANGFDCSGLIRYAYGQFGIELPRISRDQLAVGAPVELRVGALEPGDVLGFSAVVGGEATHVGLYVGDGQFIHSSTSGVRVSDLRQPYWQQHFMAARRMVR